MDDRRKKGEFVGALGALLVHVAVIALLILVRLYGYSRMKTQAAYL